MGDAIARVLSNDGGSVLHKQSAFVVSVHSFILFQLTITAFFNQSREALYRYGGVKVLEIERFVDGWELFMQRYGFTGGLLLTLLLYILCRIYLARQ